MMQRGAHQIEWENLHDLLVFSSFKDDFEDLDVSIDFTRNVQQLRSERRAAELSSTTLLGLVHRFRFQSATFGSDKIYALMGLLNADNPTLLKPNYSLSSEYVFMQFTASSIEHNKDLTAIALASGVELQDVSWCRDWRYGRDWRDDRGASSDVSCFSLISPPHRAYSTSRTYSPV
jgi:hypothetical protein